MLKGILIFSYPQLLLNDGGVGNENEEKKKEKEDNVIEKTHEPLMTALSLSTGLLEEASRGINGLLIRFQ